MEPKNPPFRKENDLPNLHDYVPAVNLQGCKLGLTPDKWSYGALLIAEICWVHRRGKRQQRIDGDRHATPMSLGLAWPLIPQKTNMDTKHGIDMANL